MHSCIQEMLNSFYDAKRREWIIPYEKHKVFCEALIDHVIVEVDQENFNGFFDDNCLEYYSNEIKTNVTKIETMLSTIFKTVSYINHKLKQLTEICVGDDLIIIEKMIIKMEKINKKRQKLEHIFYDHIFDCERIKKFKSN